MQNILALLIVAAAVGFLIRRGWRYFGARKAAGCGSGCGSCAANQGEAASGNLGSVKPLVTIEGLRSHRQP